MDIAARFGMEPKRVDTTSPLLVDSTRNVGLEIEIENINRNALRNAVRPFWEVVSDGSLRPRDESGELRPPGRGHSGGQLVESIDMLQNLDELRYASYSWRCATHAHIDMRDMDVPALHLISVLYSLVEPFIFAWEGTGRQESRFCMPWWVVSADMHTNIRLIRDEDVSAFKSAVAQFSKYTALNFRPLMQHGTIEFRHMGATVVKERLIDYINICLGIVGISERVGSLKPIDLVVTYLQDGPTSFIIEYLPPRVAALLTDVPDYSPLLTSAIQDRVLNNAIGLAEVTTTTMAKPAASAMDGLESLLDI